MGLKSAATPSEYQKESRPATAEFAGGRPWALGTTPLNGEQLN